MLKLLTSSKSLIIISAIGIGTSLVMLYRSTNTNLDNKGKGEPVAMVIRPQNDIRVKQSGVLHWLHLKDPALARSGDSIFAGENSSTTIVLKKGSEITLMPHSLIVVQDNMLDLETGSLKINLKPNEKITHIKVAGKTVKLNQPGEVTVQQIGKEVKVELKPESGGPVVDLLKTAAVVELSNEPGEILATDFKPEPTPEPAPTPRVITVVEDTPRMISRPRPIRPAPPVEEKIGPTAVPESSPKEEIIALDKKYELYYLLGQTAQSHDVTLQGAGIDAAKSYSVSGLSHEVRLEAFKLLLKPVAFTAHYTDLSTSTASYKGYGGAFEIIFKSPFSFLPNVEFIPGVYFRQYTLGLKDLIPGGTGASEAASSSTMASFMIRWRRDFDLWTAEVWPLLKAHQKDKILLDYVLLSAIGRNTRYGRFSVFHKFIQNEDTLGYSEASNENANVKTRENKLGLMYVRGF